eukprot:12929143-Prorocentrum_lima.AAC.1
MIYDRIKLFALLSKQTLRSHRIDGGILGQPVVIQAADAANLLLDIALLVAGDRQGVEVALLLLLADHAHLGDGGPEPELH